MAINSYEVKQGGQPMALADPVTGEDALNSDGKPMIFYIYGKDSSVYKTFKAEYASKIRNQKKPSTYGQDQKDSVNLLVRCTETWENVELNEGEPHLEFSHQAARELYSDHDWIAEQIDDFIVDRANHLGNSKEA